MTDRIDPDKLTDTAAQTVMKDLGQLAEIEGNLAELNHRLAALPEGAPPMQRAELLLEVARSLQLLGRGQDAWPLGREAFRTFAAQRDWEHAADACDVLYQCDQEDSLAALGNGIWLGVTFPISPETSVHLLSHMVDDTPDDSDGAAVAAATALFVADLRTTDGPDRERLVFFANQLLGKVARQHSDVQNQEAFELWVRKLELDDPDKFLVRLRNVLDVLVQDDWWINRDALQNEIPVN